MNHLQDSTSPYLKQHADNPVEWYPWGESALKRAMDEDKPILVSIGYSSCHWCHVMAHESFEDAETAEVMNNHFINIKIDREERPDLDQIYMEAVQAMGLQGGWPLNVFLMPNQKPFYGGTYFPKNGWRQLLGQINEAYKEHKTKLEESAEQFAERLTQSETERYGLHTQPLAFSVDDVQSSIGKMARRFDNEYGGFDRAPKFPMPTTWEYLLSSSFFRNDEPTRNHVLLTLSKMSNGGIYDQLGGGFSRYAVDGQWHVPHFEKMLYDNGQLLSLFAHAYQMTRRDDFKRVLVETTTWLEREMLHPEGGFYAALDADSEGVEGKFYAWTYEEFIEVAGKDRDVLCAYYDVHPKGNWEA